MLVCHCNVVTDREIRDAIRAGATDPSAIARHCSAGGDCFGCAPAIERLLEEAAMALHSPRALRSRQARRREGILRSGAVA